MLIDWFTVGAQIVNFLILIWLLKRYLYRPILNAIDAREKLIAAELADAAAQKAAAQLERDTFARKSAEHDQQAAKLMMQAQNAANNEGARLLTEAQEAADILRISLQRKFAKDSENLKRVLSDNVRQEVFNIARKSLSALAATELEDAMLDVFVRQLKTLDPITKKTFLDALETNNASQSLEIRTAVELTASQKEKLTEEISRVFSIKLHFAFKTAEALIGGIELSVNGQKLAWSIDEYLTALEERVDSLVNKNVNGASAL